jgi:hypothetical protein
MRLPSTSALFAVAAACLAIGGVALHGQRAIVHEDAFVARAAHTLAQDEVGEEAAARIDAGLVSADDELAADEGSLQLATLRAVAQPRFADAFREGAADLHHALFAGADQPVQLRVPGGAQMVAEELEPRLAARVRTVADEPLLSVGGNLKERLLRNLGPTARRLSAYGPLVLALGLVLLAAAAAATRSPRRGLHGAGLAVAAAGGVVAAGVISGRAFFLEHFDTSFGDAVAGTVWTAYLGDLKTWGLIAATVGVLAAGAASRGLTADFASLHARLARTGPLARGLTLAALGAALALQPAVVAPLAALAIAGALLYAAAAQYRTDAR